VDEQGISMTVCLKKQGWQGQRSGTISVRFGLAPLQSTTISSILGKLAEPPVTAYGASHPMEDFAETYALYCINPKVLQEQFPKRHSFMEKYIRRMQP